MRDNERNSLPDASSLTATIVNTALVKSDSTHYVTELSQKQFALHAGTTTKVDSTKITLTAGSLSQDVWVIVSP